MPQYAYPFRTRSFLLLILLMLGGCTVLGKMGQVALNPSIAVGGPDDQPSQFSLSLYASPVVNGNASSVANHSPPFTPVPPAPFSVSLSGTDALELTQNLQALIEQLQRDYPAMSASELDASDEPAMSPTAYLPLGAYDDPSISLTVPDSQADAPRPEHVTTPIAFKVLQLKDDSLLLHAAYEQLAEDLKKTLGSTLVRADDYRLMPGQFKFVHVAEIDKETRYLAVIADYHDRDQIQWKQALRIEPRGHKYAFAVQLEGDRVVLKGEG
jgi:type VI secretion system VasD/TssJ family lipoprotein